IDPDQIEKDCTPPPPPPAPAPTPSGGSTGDPHLTTFDGRKYDFQAVGEFVLAEAPGLQIQARQAPLADDPFVSVNSALAFQIGTHRLVYSQDDGLRTSLDGADAVFTDQPTRLPGGGSVVVDRYGDQTVTWPDGTRASVSAIGFWGLGLLVFPSPALKGKVAGLLGDFDGNPANDLAASGKVLLSDPPEDKQLYGVFADTWRVSAATSLLPYAAGTSTATFTDKSFPTRILTADNLSEDQRRPAQKVCAELGIAERRAQDDCVLDVARAGQPSFATGAQAAEEQIGAGTRPPAAGAVHAGGTLPDLARASDSITQGGRVDRYRLELGSATVLRLADLTGEVGTSGKATLRFDLDPPQSVDAPGFTYTAATEQWRLDPGVAYTLTVTRTDADTGPYSFVAVAAKEHKAALTFDNQASGYLDTRGRVDSLTFCP
ncbi:MAG: VWD domain-containing protein, partial [Catenulispora sp.]|nr:VWD domain-containing protein [Catenulispora sp.]